MYINTFKYSPNDVSCQLCTEYVKKLGCTALRCPWLAERIEAGVVGYREAVAAVVVQRMFRWASEGAGLNTIAVRLNEAGVLNPSHYKKMQGKITHENLLGSGKWQTRTVGVILRSEVYTGDLVQGQTKTVDHRQVKADAEEWTVVRDTHEAIISWEQFAAVQEILNQTASCAKAR